MINGSRQVSVKKAMEMALDAPIDIKSVLSGKYFAADVNACLNKKESFGLRSAQELDSILVFNVSKLCLYDYSLGKFQIYNCGSYNRMLNYLRISMDTHTIFLNCEQAVEFLRNKSIIP